MLEILYVRLAPIYGLRSFRYYATHASNGLTDDIRNSDSLQLLNEIS